MMKKVLCLLVVFVVLCCTLFSCFGGVFALAETTQEVDVLDELRRDDTFDVALFPAKSTGRDLSLITIAESVDNELVLYVYQPYTIKPYFATSVRMSTTFSTPRSTGVGVRDYSLECLSRKGVFYKYKVKGFQVLSTSVRTYNIVQLMRDFVANVDTEAQYDNTIQGVPFEVSKQYIFSDSNGETSITESHLDVVTVTSKFCGRVRYPDGFTLFQSEACDSHFIAFSTDWNIEKLYEADVSYVAETYSCSVNTGITTSEGFSNKRSGMVSFSCDDVVSYSGPGICAATFSWNRIESINDFMSGLESGSVYSGVVLDVSVGLPIDSTARAALEEKQWVLRFLETPYMSAHYSSGSWNYVSSVQYDIVSEESILRLRFLSQGTTYDLGVVDNKQSGSSTPINGVEKDTDLHLPTIPGMDWEKLLRAILLLVGVALLAVVVVWVTVKVIGAVKRNKR